MKRAFVIGALLVVLTLSLGGSVASKGTDNGATYEQLRLFTEVLSIVQNQYVDEVPPKELIYSAIKGTLRGLDPHSSFLDPDSYKEMQVETSGSFGGLGIEITLKDDILTVVSPIEGTPAYRAGLQTGDRIIKIDGLSTKDMQLPDAVKRMRGKPGTKVTITVVREGWTESKDFDITREQIRVQSVRSADLGGGIAYVKLRQFQEQTPGDLSGTLEKASKAGMKALLLDLRNNPGGLLTAAVEVTEEFIDDGKLVVYTEGASATRTCASRPTPRNPTPRSRWSCWSIRGARPRPRSWRARCKTGVARSSSGPRRSERDRCKRSSRSRTARAYDSRRRSTSPPRGGRSTARASRRTSSWRSRKRRRRDRKSTRLNSSHIEPSRM